jgi:hypothetical protein
VDLTYHKYDFTGSYYERNTSEVVVLWVVTRCNDVVGYQSLEGSSYLHF